MTVSADADESARYEVALERYLHRVVSPSGVFCCASGSLCRASIRPGHQLAAGQLSYVGPRYATKDDGRDLRILVISMQVGDAEAPVTMARRREQVRVRIPQSPKDRNPHMRGVTFALQLLFGRTPGDEYLDDGTHVLDAYAMANSTLCSNLPTGGVSRRGGPTPTMLERCRTHLLKTIETLRPTIIHTQGVATNATLEALMDECEWVSEHNARVAIGGVGAIWCPLSHPSAGGRHSWQWRTSPFFVDVAEPSLREARQFALTRV